MTRFQRLVRHFSCVFLIAALAAGCTPVRVGVKATTTTAKGAVKISAGAAKTVF